MCFNKVAIITGSSSGIGRATAVLLASKGAKVVVMGRNSTILEETVEECMRIGGSPREHVLSLTGDLRDSTFREQIIQATLEKFGKIDILVNNAGQLYVDKTGKEGFEQPVEVFEENVKTNMFMPMSLTLAVFPYLKETKGSIVFVSSIMSLSPHANMSMPYYAICKAAMDHMARSMALEYITDGVRVNVVNPGLISTPFFTKLGVPAENVKKMEEYVANNPVWIPARRPGSPEDVAKAIVFLADNNQSAYIVGQTLPVCGGASICMGIDTSDYKTPMM